MKKSFVITVPYSHLMHIKVKVNVYKTRADFIEGTGDTEALGLCQRYWKEDDEGNKILANRQVSTISLIEGHLGAGIVSHESAHAAVHIWELFNKKKLATTNDERFIELHGYTLEAYLASMSLKELVNDFVNMQPLDELPDEAYKEKFIVELERYFKHRKKEKS